MNLVIINNGKDILETNYFEHQLNKNNLFYLSFNDKAFRLLVPSEYLHVVAEMKQAKKIKIMKDTDYDMLKIMFDDLSEKPFVLNLDTRLFDRTILDCNIGQKASFSVWTGFVLGKNNHLFKEIDFLDCQILKSIWD